MTDPAVTQDQKTVTPDISEELKALREQNKALLNEKKAAVAKAKEFEGRISELEPLKERITKLGDLLGLDPQKTDPDKVRQEREVEARAKEARAAKIRDEVTFGLLESGRKLDKRVAQAIVRGALDDGGVSIDESGTVTGVPEYLASWLSTLGGANGEAPKPVDQGRVPRKPEQKPADLPEKFRPINSLLQLQAMPVADQMEFVRTYPDKYAELRGANRAALANPLPPPPPPMAQPYQAPIMVPKR